MTSVSSIRLSARTGLDQKKEHHEGYEMPTPPESGEEQIEGQKQILQGL
jgi:hypothetical protein